MARLTFLGATGCVTGSKYLLEANGQRLLVDCGLFQGKKELRLRNWERLPVDPATIDWVVLTHAHVDHTGYLPRLVRDGFEGTVFANAATHELSQILLPDSARLQEEDAAFAAERGFSKHDPPLPLYTEAEARAALALFQTVPRHADYALSEAFSIRTFGAGHILGASSVEVTVTENGARRRVLFSGDLGRYGHPILRDPEPPGDTEPVDALVCESTYGDRTHPDSSPHEALAGPIRRAAGRGGVVVIPAFAVGRTQTLIYLLRQLEDWQRIPRLPVYIDSPMAIEATGLYRAHHEDHNLAFTREESSADPLATHEMKMTRTVEESREIQKNSRPCIIIAGSGMATGGRVLHHLKQRLPDARNLVLLVGFQAEGTRGRSLLEGAPTLRIHGEDVPVRAEVVYLDQFSAHADRGELLRWLGGMPAPRRLFLTHGEPEATRALRSAIENGLGWKGVLLPEYRQSFSL